MGNLGSCLAPPMPLVTAAQHFHLCTLNCSHVRQNCYIRLSVCVSVCLSIFLFPCLSFCLCLSVYSWSVALSVSLSASLSVGVSPVAPACVCDYPSVTCVCAVSVLVGMPFWNSCFCDSPCCTAHRVFAFTRLNAHSSRSHAIVMLTIIKRHRIAPGQEEGPLQKVKIGKLFMVDLAGSERLKKSLSTGMALACRLSQAQWPCSLNFGESGFCGSGGLHLAMAGSVHRE